jgi:hypothetical protein
MCDYFEQVDARVEGNSGWVEVTHLLHRTIFISRIQSDALPRVRTIAQPFVRQRRRDAMARPEGDKIIELGCGSLSTIAFAPPVDRRAAAISSM